MDDVRVDDARADVLLNAFALYAMRTNGLVICEERILRLHYTACTAWDVEYTDQFGDWFEGLALEQQRSIIASIEHLEHHGPGLGRPLVDTIRGSRHTNMKELRPAAGGIRVLFAFDPRRMAILLIGGDKSGRWREWYQETIPVADDLYDEHLRILREEGLIL